MKPRQHGRRRRAHLQQGVDLNITAFMNLMVVLVPFLLTTAVFSRLAVLEIEVPTPSPDVKLETPPPPPPPDELPFTLAVRLEADRMVILAGREQPVPISRLEDGAYDRAALTEALVAVKGLHPEHTKISIMNRADTPYGDLIAAMDAVQVTPDGTALFPDVALGEFRP